MLPNPTLPESRVAPLAVLRLCLTASLARAFLALATAPASPACSGKPRSREPECRDTLP
jgi:hypothetical protein